LVDFYTFCTCGNGKEHEQFYKIYQFTLTVSPRYQNDVLTAHFRVNHRSAFDRTSCSQLSQCEVVQCSYFPIFWSEILLAGFCKLVLEDKRDFCQGHQHWLVVTLTEHAMVEQLPGCDQIRAHGQRIVCSKCRIDTGFYKKTPTKTFVMCTVTLL